MPGYIEDRWLTKRKDPKTGKRKRTARYGKGKRYRVGGIPGVRDRSFNTHDDAKTWLTDSQTDSSRGTFTDPRDGSITMDEYVDEYWLPGRGGAAGSRKFTDARLNYIRDAFGAVPLNAITSAGIRKFIAYLTDTKQAALASSYGHTICSLLANILDIAVEDKRIPSNPARSSSVVFPSKKTKEKREAWSDAVVHRVRECIDGRHRIAVIIGVGCGLRQGEVFGLSVEDFDFDNLVVHVRRQVRIDNGAKRYFKLPKGEKTRVAKMPRSVAQEVRAYMREYPPTEVELPWGAEDATETQKHRLLLTTAAGKAINYKDWNSYVWKPALVAADVIPTPPPGTIRRRFPHSRKYGFHALRHTFASKVLHAGESIVTLAAWLGHDSPTITLEYYAHFIPDTGTKGMAAIDALLGIPGRRAPLVLILPTDSPAPIWKPPTDTKPQVKRLHGTAGRVSPLVTLPAGGSRESGPDVSQTDVSRETNRFNKAS
ncbi:site-specific integrase [Streptomyces yunnanensis]|uniref:Site-specific integrase n=1 Tax=Streptomyces yunnanensis TaxID=156453 RepID=A0ABY8A9S2_9ACTN|nr:site-specific integrase [Streptomyces yunnanensis]WEB41538.1 site-specific integrase [Streptomyces yunnanensis]